MRHNCVSTDDDDDDSDGQTDMERDEAWMNRVDGADAEAKLGRMLDVIESFWHSQKEPQSHVETKAIDERG